MTNLWEDRERAAEYGFAHEAERHFLAARRGVGALGSWTASRTGLDPDAYSAALVGEFVAGASTSALVRHVEADLVSAGMQPRAGEVDAILAWATADAESALRGRHQAAATPPSAPQEFHGKHGFWGWDV